MHKISAFKNILESLNTGFSDVNFLQWVQTDQNFFNESRPPSKWSARPFYASMLTSTSSDVIHVVLRIFHSWCSSRPSTIKICCSFMGFLSGLGKGSCIKKRKKKSKHQMLQWGARNEYNYKETESLLLTRYSWFSLWIHRSLQYSTLG